MGCALDLVVAAVSICDQDTAEALKEILWPFSAAALPVLKAAQLDARTFYR